MDRGWIKLYRKLLDSDMFNFPCMNNVFVWLLLRATHGTYTYPTGETVGAGQLITSMKRIANSCGVSRGQARRILQNLAKAERITYESTNRYTRVTIVNWQEYQSGDTQMDGKRPATEQQPDTYENKNKNSITSPKGDVVPAGFYEEVIGHLNSLAKTRFNAAAASTQSLLRARFREGHSLQDFKTVIEVKCREWLGDDKMAQYLRPSTLFRASNFENYLHGRQGAEEWTFTPKEDRDAAAN